VAFGEKRAAERADEAAAVPAAAWTNWRRERDMRSSG
jgi:hypothetical protein